MAPLSMASNDEQPLVSVSIVSHGDQQPLLALLESLAAHESARRIQLLITDNLGRDLPELHPVGWHSTLIARPDRPRGFAVNHNAAFPSATGEYFCVLNPDVLFTQPVFAGLIQDLGKGQGDIAAPVLVNSPGEIQDSFRDLPTPWGIVRRWLGFDATKPNLEPGSFLHPDWIAGTFMLMRSAAFSRLGGFDGRYRLYFEDVDLCTRARLDGMTMLVDPSLRVLHDPRRRSRRVGRHLVWHVQSAIRFFASDVYRRARRSSLYA